MNKKNWIFFIALLLLVAIVVVNSTVFLVRNIDVAYEFNDKYTKRDILSEAESIQYSNIFTVSKTKLIDKLEKSVPYANVYGIEKKFPNRVLIHVKARHNTFAIQITDSEYYCIMDVDMKILSVEALDVSTIATYTDENDICLVLGLTLNIAEPHKAEGDFVSVQSNAQLAKLQRIVQVSSSINPNLGGTGFSAFFLAIDFSDEAYIKMITRDSDEEVWQLNVATFESELANAVSLKTA